MVEESQVPVAICIATYRRAEGLTRLLHGLGRLEFQSAPAPRVQVLVVDNDPAGSAADVCERMRAGLSWPLRYVAEPRRGVSYARNRAIAALEPSVRFLAFLDDDEVPEPRWLDELLRVQAAYEADVVAGPVVPRFGSDAPAWVRNGRFFDLRRYPTGHLLDCADTGNVLVRTDVFRDTGLRFDETLALSGGEDTMLFLQVARRGYRLVWADAAVAHEWIPETRTRAGWILRRSFRQGNTWSLCERVLEPGLRVLGVRIAKGLGRIGLGILLLPLSPFGGRAAVVRVLRQMSYGTGNLVGLAGVRYEEYRTSHGS
jgi:GT2 family glycosyltransferase